MSDRLDKEELEEVANLISKKVIPEIIRIADTYNYDRDSLIKYVADLFSTMADVATFENWKGSKGEWIPVSERLPESHGWYLVTKKDRHPYKHEWTGGIHCRVERYIEHSLWGRSNNCGVVAWMPLPKPYKAESEDKE